MQEQQAETESERTININQAITTFIISDILFLFLITFCFFILFKIIIRPIKELTNLCDQMREGRLMTKTIGSDIEEIHQLTLSFDQMIGDLKDYKTRIEKANETLEVKVKERTQELEKLAATLEEKIKARTDQLQLKIEELEKFQKLAVGRELKMIEQKEEIERLNQQLGNQIK